MHLRRKFCCSSCNFREYFPWFWRADAHTTTLSWCPESSSYDSESIWSSLLIWPLFSSQSYLLSQLSTYLRPWTHQMTLYPTYANAQHISSHALLPLEIPSFHLTYWNINIEPVLQIIQSQINPEHSMTGNCTLLPHHHHPATAIHHDTYNYYPRRCSWTTTSSKKHFWSSLQN